MSKTIETSNQRQLLSIGFLFGLGLLLANDHYLKQAFPGCITGKISDFAGLFVFPMFFSAFFPKHKCPIYLTTFLLFLIWKSPIANGPIDLANQILPFHIGRVIDYSDFIALSVLPISYHYHPTSILVKNRAAVIRFMISVLSLFGFVATAGVVGNIKIYSFNYSKQQIHAAVVSLLGDYLELRVPAGDADMTKEHYIGPPTDKRINELNADSLNFHFLISSDERIVAWASFVEMSDNWVVKPCEVGLLGIYQSGGKWRYGKDLSSEEKEKVIGEFEQRVLPKLNEELSKMFGQ